MQPTVAICVGTRIGRGGVTGFVQPNPENLRKFVVDFAGGDLPLIPKDAPVEPVITLSRGKVEPVTSLGGLFRVSPFLRPLPEINGWRCTFDLSWEGTEPIDIRLFLRLGPTTLTETWLYLWTRRTGDALQSGAQRRQFGAKTDSSKGIQALNLLALLSDIVAVMAPVFLIAALGYGWARAELPYDGPFITTLMINVATPCLVFATLLAPAFRCDRACDRRHGLAGLPGAGRRISFVVLRLARCRCGSICRR